MTNVLVCIKRVPDSTGEIVLTDDGLRIDGRFGGYTTSPHEECAVEIASQIAEGGTVTVLTLGGEDAVEQLRAALAVGATDGVRIDADAEVFGPGDVAAAVAEVVQAREAAGTTYDVVLLGNDAADTGDFQVGIDLAYKLARPVVVGVQAVEIAHDKARMRVDTAAGTEVYDVALPVVATVLEGGVSPRYPSITGKIKAKKAPVETVTTAVEPLGTGRLALRVPPAPPSQVKILGEGTAAVPRLAQVLNELGVVR